MIDENSPRMTNIGFAATAAAILTLMCVVIGEGAQLFAANLAPATTAVAAATPRPQFNAIDYATTGSVKGQLVVISPCSAEKTTP